MHIKKKIKVTLNRIAKTQKYISKTSAEAQSKLRKLIFIKKYIFILMRKHFSENFINSETLHSGIIIIKTRFGNKIF